MPDDKKRVNEPESELASAQMRGDAPVSVEKASRMLLAAQSELERLGIKTAGLVEKSKVLEAQQALEALKAAGSKLEGLGTETNRILNRSELIDAEKALAKMQAALILMESSGQIFVDESEFSVLKSPQPQPVQETSTMPEDEVKSTFDAAPQLISSATLYPKRSPIPSTDETIAAWDRANDKSLDPKNRQPPVHTDYGGGAWSTRFPRYDE